METYAETDGVTGAVAEVELVVDLPVERVWELVTDVGRLGEWSPEVASAAWRPDQGAAPRAGAVFDGHNDFGDGDLVDVECVVTEAVRPSVFEWVVLDDTRDVDRPGSFWRYELEPAGPGGTRVRHRFTHGPGMTGIREGIAVRPDRARAIVDGRLAMLRRNMDATLRAMTGTGAGR